MSLGLYRENIIHLKQIWSHMLMPDHKYTRLISVVFLGSGWKPVASSGQTILGYKLSSALMDILMTLWSNITGKEEKFMVKEMIFHNNKSLNWWSRGLKNFTSFWTTKILVLIVFIMLINLVLSPKSSTHIVFQERGKPGNLMMQENEGQDKADPHGMNGG